MDKFIILKSSWGIAISYEIIEIINHNQNDENENEVSPSVFVRLKENSLDNSSLEYLTKGIKSITQFIKIFPVCFSIEKLEYNVSDYQPEGMYYMFRKWFFENHNMELPPINVYYNKETNKYVFPDLINVEEL
ncbi:hypothetical protein LXM63_18655 [Chryseobacterium gleum]|uniref:hypothetical protein n=1 Tax=Chryseobacterium gleum TaxID=250 RepID=UPI001E30CDDE|nr:hypothetical protein [Chryseobacterium gleum]MCE4067128.1 hypothetical protein [Chryseobacterium gleum]